MHNKATFIIGIITLLSCFTGCAGRNLVSDVNGKLENDLFFIKLKSKAHVGYLKKPKKGVSCKSISKKDFRIELTKESNGEKLSYVNDCVSFKGYLWVRSKNLLEKGLYKFKVRKENEKKLIKLGSVRTQYKNSEFDSNEDQKPKNPLILEEDSNLVNRVSYNHGDRTDWIRIDGNSGSVSLTFSEDNKGKRSAFASIYRGKSRPRFVTRLKPDEAKNFSLSRSSNLYVRVRSHLYREGSEYVIKRKQPEAGAKRMAVQVTDCFPVTENSSMALIANPKGLKMGEEVLIYGKLRRGGKEKIGVCQISSLSDSHANCDLSFLVTQNYASFSGQTKGSIN